MTSNNFDSFWHWFDNIRSSVSIREIEKQARVPRGRIGNVYRKKRPSAKVCESIAIGLGIEKREVLQQAGYLNYSEEAELENPS